MKNFIFLFICILFIGCYDNSDVDDSETNNNEINTSNVDCEAGEVPEDQCIDGNIVEFSGDYTIINDECVFSMKTIECNISAGILYDSNGDADEEISSDGKTCIVTSDGENRCWSPCDEVICGDPEEPKCSSTRRLRTYIIGTGECQLIGTFDNTQEVKCYYETEYEDCENSCVEADDGPDYCI